MQFMFFRELHLLQILLNAQESESGGHERNLV